MAQKISGGCACGAIHYECNADPVVMLNCHCRDCQRASGSAYAAVVVVPKNAVQMRGEPRYYKVVGKAGKLNVVFARPAAAKSRRNWKGCRTSWHCRREASMIHLSTGR